MKADKTSIVKIALRGNNFNKFFITLILKLLGKVMNYPRDLQLCGMLGKKLFRVVNDYQNPLRKLGSKEGFWDERISRIAS
jgi:hypothetical protein